MKKYLFAFLLFPVFGNLFAQQQYTQYVNPFIGTGGHGHTFPGATLPHGMMQLSPDTRLDGWDGCSGYHYSDSFIYGFSHTHLSGTGVSDYGDILLMPMNGVPSPDNKIYGSAFRHVNEKAAAGYYSVLLDDDNINAEFTTTERAGMHHYVFSNAFESNIILDLVHRDEVIESELNIEDSVTVSGLRRSKAWAKDQYVYFVIRFSKPIIKNGIWQDGKLTENQKYASSKNIRAYFQFNLATSKDIYAKVSISPVSIQGAKKNLETEMPEWNFEALKASADQKWNAELSKIEVRSPDTEKLRIFYTALYHTAITPNINMDVDGQYRGMDGKIYKADGFNYYSVFSLWDTYRATHPLYTIIDQSRTLDYIKTFLAQYSQGGMLPVWELAGNETNCMIGYHSVSVIADAYAKGITGFDTNLALAAMKKSATADQFGLPAYIKNGLVTVDDEAENVSRTLEYAYDDWCIAQFARLTGHEDDYKNYIGRAQYYKNVLNVKTAFMQPRRNGDWLSPFDPREVNNNFTEANSWQYSFYFPQDIGGYMQLTGGARKFEEKLNNLFSTSSETTGREQSDITGLIGQYAHGNEPSHHISYLYDFTGKAYKTQELVHRIMTEMYHDAPDGLIGNEDCGQMSAWYVMSALGFYPVTPGSTNYMIGAPSFSLATINLENEKTFVINAPGVDDKNYYIQNVLISTAKKLRPTPWDSAYLKHSDIVNGGLITFMMGDKPSAVFSTVPKDAITAIPSGQHIVVNPVIEGGAVPFRGAKKIAMSVSQKNAIIYFTTDGSAPTEKSKKYITPFSIDRSMIVKAIAVNARKEKSFVTSAEYNKIENNWTVQYNSMYEPQYNAGGADALVDGMRGTVNWRKGNWQGFQKTDMDVVVDLKQQKTVSKVMIGFLQDVNAWIVMPKELIIEVSTDGTNYKQIYKGGEFLYIEDPTVQIMEMEPSFPAVTARYVRIKAKQYGKLPDWHPGAGGDTHIFVDEIQVK